MDINSYQIAFICQPGELEVKSLLLAYSLHANNRVNITALIPQHCKDKVSMETISIFKQLQVEMVFFKNPFIQNKENIESGDWMSNKFYGLKSLSAYTDILFLDSDIINIDNRNIEIDSQYAFAAKPADISSTANWTELFNLLKQPFPSRRTQCTVDNIESIPYFNSGVLYLKKDFLATILSYWEHYFIWLSSSEILVKGLFDIFHRDQIALSLAIEKLQCNYYRLSEQWNYPIRHRIRIMPECVFVHYHDFYTFRKSSVLLAEHDSFLKAFPEIEAVWKKVKPWSYLLSDNKTMILMYMVYIKLRRTLSKTLALLK